MPFLSDSGMTIKQVVDELEKQIKLLQEQIVAVEELKTKIEEIDEKLQTLLDVELGNWEIVDNHLIFKDKNNNQIAKFALFDKKGRPTERSIMKRERVE